MEREKLESLIIDYIDGKLPETERALLEKELVHHQELYHQLREVMAAIDQSEPLEPGSRLRNNFDKMLREEMSKGKSVPMFSPTLYRMAAAVVLVMAGIVIGFYINKNQQHEQELALLKKEVENTKQMMIAMIGNPNSASQRLQGVNVAFTIVAPDHDIVSALVKTMNEDPNTNVRLAALEALGKFYGDATVRKALIESLSTQKDPVVQISLIQLMVKMNEKGSVKNLEQIIEDNMTIKPVKDEAYSGLLKLS
jgi:hypothetical protein